MTTKTKKRLQTMEIDNDLLSRSAQRVTIRYDPKDTVVLESSWDYRADAPAYPFEGKAIPLEKGVTHSGMVIYEVAEGRDSTAETEVPRKIEALDGEGRWVPYPSVSFTCLWGCCVRVIFKDSDGKFKVGASGRCFKDGKLLDSALNAGLLVDQNR